mgnify:CR=1 FL=1|jgi:hypothetical protein|tara:strand:+ start:40 stop:882 length:843 start_codon:yes stop_codon:yes gene_type:complete
MAKKKTAAKAAPEVEVAQPEIKATNKMVEVVIDKPQPKKPTWEIKDRVYYLKGNKKPISRSIRSANVFWFDEEKGYERELKYCENQKTPFVDEMVGDQRLSHIIFQNGALFVERTKTTLQKLLSLYHPDKDKLFYEHKPAEIAESEIEVLEMEADAIILARQIDIDMAEAIMRVEKGSEVSKMSSKELKRDLLVFARNNPALFLELAADDNVQLRNFGIKAVELGIVKLSNDQRNFLWGSTDRKIMTVPFDEHPYTALAHWFKTDEGMEIYANIEKRLNA